MPNAFEHVSSLDSRRSIPLLAPHFHVVTPDLPGFGFTEPPEGCKYSFSSITETIEHFVDARKL